MVQIISLNTQVGYALTLKLLASSLFASASTSFTSTGTLLTLLLFELKLFCNSATCGLARAQCGHHPQNI